MFKKLVMIAIVLTALMATATPAFAARGTYYVWKGFTGTELGTMAQPYKTFDAAIAAAQSNNDGGYIYEKTSADGTYHYVMTIAGVNSPPGGAPLSRTALLVLLGIASLILVAMGWFLMRRSHNLPSRI